MILLKEVTGVGNMLNELQKVQTELKFDCDDYDYKKLLQNEFDMLSKDTPSR